MNESLESVSPDSLSIDFSAKTALQILALARDQYTADAFFEQEVKDTVDANASKYTQPDTASLTDMKQYQIFVALQTMEGHVQRLAHMSMLRMLDEVCATAMKAA
ncbi:MAG: hypothetical protein MnENMB40S_09300 [Rhizobiaceae bacterium MnEN-MB40S]|nr:MAG: hypothetical protein MnENMB40S_09300 [Rhizobiaceae bacterium MnEN-MB40S]